jgi:protein ImuB
LQPRLKPGLCDGTNRCILLVRTAANRQTVACACPRAVEAGVRPGMTLAHARALLPRRGGEPCVREHDPQRDRHGLLRLARWATRFAPAVQVDGDDGLLMDVTGCARLYHGESNLLARLIDALTRLGFTASAVIAPTFGAAWALARYGHDEAAARHRILERPDQIPAALAPLPIAALRLDDQTIEALNEVGVRCIGELLHVSRRQLPSRFCKDLMLRIDQALGAAIETINPVRVPQPAAVERPFDGPVKNLEAIQAAARQLLDAFCGQLLQRESGVVSLRLTLRRCEADPVTLALTVSRATRDAKHLWQLLRPQLEQANLGHGVEAIELRAAESARLPHRQRHAPQLTGEQAAHDAAGEERGRLLDVLMHRLGPQRVVRFQCVESHLPERAIQWTPVDRSLNQTERFSWTNHRLAAEQGHASVEGGEPRPRPGLYAPAVRPTQLFDQPEPVDVQALTPDGPVAQVAWRGRPMRVTFCAGPERLTSPWWCEPTGSRDYFHVQVDTGQHLWLFRDARLGRWFLHGWWA